MMKKVSILSKLMLVAVMSLPVCGQMNAGVFYDGIRGLKKAANWCCDTYQENKEYVKPVLTGMAAGVCAKVAVNVIRSKDKTDTENLVTYAIIGGVVGYLYWLSKKQSTMHKDVKEIKEKVRENGSGIAENGKGITMSQQLIEKNATKIEAAKETLKREIQAGNKDIKEKIELLSKVLSLTKEQVEELKKEFGNKLDNNAEKLEEILVVISPKKEK